MSDRSSGNWRQGEHVLLGDVLLPVEATLVWLALLTIAVAGGLPALQGAGLVQPGPLSVLLRQSWFVYALTITADLVLLFFLWRVARRVSADALVARFRAVRGTVLVIAALSGAAFAVATIAGSAWLVLHKFIEFHPAPNEKLVAPGPLWQLAITFVAVGLVAPLVEEFYFRGVFLSWAGRKAGYWVAVPASAAIFALLHFRFNSHPGIEGWLLTGVIAVVGLINGLLALVTRSLWPPVLFHAGYNTMLLLTALAPLLLRQSATALLPW